MESLKLEAYGLREMSRTEASEIDGGTLLNMGAGLVQGAISFWGDFADGFSSGFNNECIQC